MLAATIISNRAVISLPSFVQINNDFYEDLDQESTKQIIENIKNNIPNKIGSQKGRKSSENA